EVDTVHVRADTDSDVGTLAIPPRQKHIQIPQPRPQIARVDAKRIPPLPEVGDAAQGRLAFAAEMNRRVRLLNRLRVLATRIELIQLTRILRYRFTPETTHHFEVFARPLCSTLERHAQSLEFFGQPANANAEIDTAIGQAVHRRNVLRGV